MNSSPWKRRLCIVAIGLVLVGIFHAPILTSYAELLTVVSDSSRPLDAVVFGKSLGGTRAILEAAAIFESGETKRILIVAETPDRLQQMDIIPTFEATSKRILMEHGVPPSAIEILDRRVEFKEWLEQNDDAHVVVLVAQFASRKEAVTAQRTFGEACAKRIEWHSIPDERFDTTDWWQHRQGILMVFSETISLSNILLGGKPERDCDDDNSDGGLDWDVNEYENELCRTTSVLTN